MYLSSQLIKCWSNSPNYFLRSSFKQPSLSLLVCFISSCLFLSYNSGNFPSLVLSLYGFLMNLKISRCLVFPMRRVCSTSVGDQFSCTRVLCSLISLKSIPHRGITEEEYRALCCCCGVDEIGATMDLSWWLCCL